MMAAEKEEEEGEEEEEEEKESLVGLVDDCLPDDDDLLRFLDDTSVSNRGVEQGDKEEGVEGLEEEEEEEELEWLSNSDAFPMLDPSVAFGPVTAASVGSVTLEGLETVIKELENQEAGKLEAEKVVVPKKRRSDVRRRPREVLFPIPLLLGDEGRNGSENGNGERVSVRRCTHCRVKETPQWRQGPAGPGTLCNACGVRYKSGRLYDEYRPANSPTFSPGRHSNFHRKVIEMRVEKQTDGVVSNLKKAGQSGLDGSEQGQWRGA